MSWISGRDKNALFLITFLQVISGILDLLSVLGTSLLVGVYLSPEEQINLGDSISNLFPFINLINGEGVVEFLVVGVFCLLAIKGLFSLILTKILLSRLSRISKEVSKVKFQQLLNQPLSFSKTTNKVELGYALSDGVSVLLIGILSAAIALITEISLIVIVSLGLIAVNKGIGLFLLVYFLLLILVMSKVLGKQIDISAKNFVTASIKSRTAINDTLFLFREVKAMSKSPFFLSRYFSSAELAASGYSHLIWWQQFPKFVYELALLSAIGLLGIFTWLFMDEEQAILLGMTFAIAGLKMVPAILRLQAANLTLRDFNGRAREVFPLLATLDRSAKFQLSQELIEPDAPISPPPKIELKNVSYRYSDNRDVIRNLSFVFEPGAVTYLNGKSGSGKTTLCDLIMDFLMPDSGEILFDGKTYLDWINHGKQRIALMPQEPHFFVGTIRENLLMGSVGKSVEDCEIDRILKKLDLYEHISVLPEGLDTVITDRNLEFSGGQKQRLAIARTLLVKPNFCIIDEGTSALDMNTEKAIELILDELYGNCTLIRIAHKKNLGDESNVRVLNL
jgi:ABC-type multidrug transport system fused ATPase/permease subunit